MEQTVQTLIAADNHWALLAVLFAATAFAIWLEQKYRWASKISGAIITLVIALVLFLIVKAFNKAKEMKKKEEAPAEPTTKKCPFCLSEIDIKATRCPHCTSELK